MLIKAHIIRVPIHIVVMRGRRRLQEKWTGLEAAVCLIDFEIPAQVLGSPMWASLIR